MRKGPDVAEMSELSKLAVDMAEGMTPDEQADAILEERITSLVKRWPSAIEDAREGVQGALAIFGELMKCDVETFDSAWSGEAETVLREAWQRLNQAFILAGERLRPIEDAEKDAELARLRAEVASLRQSLAGAHGAED